MRAQLRKLPDEIDDALAQQRLSAGYTNFFNPEPSKDTRNAQVVGNRQLGKLRTVVPRSAVHTLVVTAVGNSDPQVGNIAPVFVFESHAALKWGNFGTRGTPVV